MTERPPPGERLTATELAQRLGTSVPAVSNWRRRHASFPAAAPGPRGGTFDVGELASWLADRRIPDGLLRPGEQSGTTYAQRLVHGFQVVDADQPARAIEAVSEKELRNLVDGFRAEPEFRDAMLGLLAVRLQHPDVFAELAESAERGDEGRVEHLLRRIEHEVGPLFPDLPQPHRGLRPLHRLIGLVRDLVLPAPDDRTALGHLVLRLVQLMAPSPGPGDHFTPSRLARLMVLVTGPGRGARIHDPFCRAGELLAAVIAHTPRDAFATMELSGDAMVMRFDLLSRAALALTGADVEIGLRNALVESRPDDGGYDVIMANPPYSLKSWELPGPGPRTWWRYGGPPAHNANFAWLQRIMEMLSSEGRAAVLMPNHTTTSENAAERRIRESMVADGVVECVVALPDRLFASTGIAICLWILRSPGTATARREVLLVDATSSGTVSRARRDLSDADVERIADEYERWRQRGDDYEPTPGLAAVVPIGELLGNSFGLNPRAHVRPLVEEQRPAARGAEFAELHRRREQVHLRVQDLRSAVDNRMQLVDPVGGGTGEPVVRARLGDLCELVAGPGRFDHDAGGLVHHVVTPRALRHNRIVDVEAVAEVVAEQVERYRLSLGDIVCVRTGNIGRVGVVGPEHVGWLVGSGCVRLRPGREVDPEYLASYLSSPAVREWIDRHASGSAIRALNTRTLGELPVLLPGHAEQRRIASILTALDAEAAALDQLGEVTAQLRDLIAGTVLPVDRGRAVSASE
ncbi:N-6 DNA methylase [Pseudonocardia lacus]|uniref:N-6 DNA methylase n=1 Tax=Pseudonocardia lacus TaxID=2835865 RepID=UPI001BDC4633|nr:N-6 DNA methylase [Pseudonocardia lacus]